MGRWMSESHDRYEMFSREFYWSPAQLYFFSETDEESEWKVIYDKASREYIAKVHVPIQGFRWEEEFDHSKKETIGFKTQQSCF